MLCHKNLSAYKTDLFKLLFADDLEKVFVVFVFSVLWKLHMQIFKNKNAPQELRGVVKFNLLLQDLSSLRLRLLFLRH